MARFLIFLVLAIPTFASAAMERNSYLNESVHDVSGLLHEIQTDAQVADRYMRHYALDKSSVMVYMSTLHASTLWRDMKFMQYGCYPDGLIHAHESILHKGEPIFVDKHDKPILRMACGNPLEGGSELTFDHKLSPKVTARAANVRTIGGGGSGLPSEQISAVLEPQLVATTLPALPVAPAIVPTVANQVFRTVASNSSDWLAAIPLLPIVVSPKGSTPTPQSVPEPMTLLLLGAGTFGAWRARRKLP